MPFVLKKYKTIQGEKIQHFLANEAGLSMPLVQKLLSKNRVFNDQDQILKNGQTINGDFVQVAVFEGHTRGLKPIFETHDFAVFDKPSGIMVHPTRKTTQYCLLDEVRYYFGDDASLAHRIDAETSGVVLVAKNKSVSSVLKTMFENKKYTKEYLALVKGRVRGELIINKPIEKADSSIKVKMTCNTKQGKTSKTYIYPVEFNKTNNTTLVKVIPVTGRQHQIRVHLDSIGHTIVGDPIYGVDESIVNDYLSKKLVSQKRIEHTGAERLMLHANRLAFTYNDTEYDIMSEQAKTIFNQFSRVNF